ncbi:PrsW family glutamic-type intramembrane protease [Chloroflexota bacterium]
MLQQMTGFFTLWFTSFTLSGLLLAVLFGGIWLLIIRPPLLRRIDAWLLLLGSALVTWTAISFIQLPLQNYLGQWLVELLGLKIMTWLLIAGIPTILIGGLTQEAAKMLPAILFRMKNRQMFTPGTGLMLGAMIGIGFGVFEAVWVNSSMFQSGWTWAAFQQYGVEAILPFWERFITVGLHMATGAILGYGVARGRVWQFFLIAAGVHALYNYSVLLLQGGYLGTISVEIYITAVALVSSSWVLYKKVRISEVSETNVSLADEP